MNYNKIAQEIRQIHCQVSEFFRYLYLPIKLRGQSSVTGEKRLYPIDPVVGAACCDFVGRDGLDKFVDSYVYLTARNEYQPPNQAFNRAGWHSDGFGTDDISYIWSNRQPTIFNSGNFFLSDDDVFSMQEMEEQAQSCYDYTFPNETLIRMDQYSIHRVGEPEEGVRCFVKIVFSKDKFDLQGNSINYNLDYQWNYRPRRATRNIPQNLAR